VNNRLVGKILDPDGAGEEEASEEYYAYDQTPFSTRENASQMLFRFTGPTVDDLADRYMWAPVVDMLLSDEKLTAPDEPGDVYWALGDNLNTVRDIAQYDAGTDTTTIVNHRVFDAFGNITSESNSAVDLIFAFTGRLYDESTGLQNNLNRWYDPTIGRWLSKTRSPSPRATRTCTGTSTTGRHTRPTRAVSPAAEAAGAPRRGPEITLFINGTLMCQFTDRDAKQAASKGIIALQMHPGPPMKIEVKNIRLKEL
jgi:RHS repeat-associated protein